MERASGTVSVLFTDLVGSTELMGTLGDVVAADRRAAAEVGARIGARGTLIHTQLAWAPMLLARRGPGDEERARELAGQAVEAARELDLPAMEQRAAALLE